MNGDISFSNNVFHMMIAFHSGYPLDNIKSQECLLYLSFPHPKVPTLLSSFSSHSSHLLHFQVFCFREKKKHLKSGIRLKKNEKEGSYGTRWGNHQKWYLFQTYASLPYICHASLLCTGYKMGDAR